MEWVAHSISGAVIRLSRNLMIADDFLERWPGGRGHLGLRLCLVAGGTVPTDRRRWQRRW